MDSLGVYPAEFGITLSIWDRSPFEVPPFRVALKISGKKLFYVYKSDMKEVVMVG